MINIQKNLFMISSKNLQQMALQNCTRLIWLFASSVLNRVRVANSSQNLQQMALQLYQINLAIFIQCFESRQSGKVRGVLLVVCVSSAELS